MAIQSARYEVIKAPGKWDLAVGYFDFDERTERERMISFTLRNYDTTYVLECYIDHIRRTGALVDARKGEQYFEGNCRGIPFDGDHGNDYPVRGVISLIDRTGWLEFNPPNRQSQLRREIRKLLELSATNDTQELRGKLQDLLSHL